MCECIEEPIKCSYRRHCIHQAIQCVKDRLQYQNNNEFQQKFIEQLQKDIKEYLQEHPDIGLEL
ncbi:MAG TPA: hypothetical protein VNX68_07935 [Nitrosopumilaceae archaeon]|jgi:hypothetical protein|nr:hypothetical protein [Nitrosopumilaceae archaeon]